MTVELSDFLRVPQKLDALEERLARLSETLTRQGVELEAHSELLQGTTDSLEQLAEESQVLQRATAEQARLGEQHYEAHVIEPLVRQLLPLADLAREALSKRPEDGTLRALAALAGELLGRYGLERFESPVGSGYSPSSMRVVQTVPVDDRSQHHTIARTLRAGYRRADRIVRFEHVALFQNQAA